MNSCLDLTVGKNSGERAFCIVQVSLKTWTFFSRSEKVCVT